MTNHTVRRSACVVWFVVCASSFAVTDAEGCFCDGTPPACEAVSYATAVFVGRVTNIDGSDSEFAKVEFDVERPVKGVARGRIVVDSGPGMCGISFQAGERYVVYAFRGPSGALETGACSRTRPLTAPQTRADLMHFDRLRKRALQGNLLTGVVFDATRDLANRSPPWPGLPMAGVGVTASDASGPPRTTTTRTDGSYEFRGVPAGSLRVSATASSEFAEHEPVTITLRGANGCAELNLAVRVDGRIRSRLLDEDGRPVRGVAVHLADATIARTQGPPPPTLTATTDEHGVFDFRHVGPGRYVIGVALQEYVRPGKLDRRRFYAETRDPASAMVIELGTAERLELPPFKLARLPADRTITIVVRAPDRETAAATNVIVTGATRERVDHRGEPLTLRLPFGAQYLIEATPPEGYRIQERAVRIELDDADRTIEFRVERNEAN